MSRYKAPEILRSEAYLQVRRNDEGPARRQGKRSRWPFFSNLPEQCELISPPITIRICRGDAGGWGIVQSGDGEWLKEKH